MAVATKDRRFTRSRQKTVPVGLTEKPEPRSLRLRKAATSDLGKTGNCTVVISKLELENTKEDAKRRKRTRVDIEDRNEVEKETKAKKTRAVQENNETRERASRRKGKEDQSTSKQREREFEQPKVQMPGGVKLKFGFDQTAKKSPVHTDESLGSSSLSEVESENQKSLSESESGMASGYQSSPSSLSSSSDRESDSPVPTSELSDSSDNIDSSSDESSSSGDIVTWRTRKSPRKQAQAKSRKKIAELCKPESEDSLSPSSSESSYSVD